MTDMTRLIGRKSCVIGSGITVRIPTVGEIRDDGGYLREARLFTVSARELIPELCDLGIDYESISAFELFLLLFESMRKTAPLPRERVFTGFELFGLEMKERSGHTALCSGDGREVINERSFSEISALLRTILGEREKPGIKSGNTYAKRKRIEYERFKREKAVKQGGDPLGEMILSLVCCADFPYDFRTINDITVCELTAACRQIQKQSTAFCRRHS